MEASESTGVIAPHIVGYPMSSVFEVKIIDKGDNVRLVVPRSYFHQLGLERGDTLLVTVVEEKSRSRKKAAKAHAQRARRHN